MSNDLSERLSEIRERAEAATEGPGIREVIERAVIDAYCEGVSDGDGDDLSVMSKPGIQHFAQEWCDNKLPESLESNPARSDVPYLLSLVEDLLDAVRESKGELQTIRTDLGMTIVEATGPKSAIRQCQKRNDEALKDVIERLSAALRDAAQEASDDPNR